MQKENVLQVPDMTGSALLISSQAVCGRDNVQ